MTPLSFAEANGKYPDKVQRVLVKLTADHKTAIDPQTVDWFVMACHDDPDQPLNEASCADIMLTGSLVYHEGLYGRIDGQFACSCDKKFVAVDKLRRA